MRLGAYLDPLADKALLVDLPVADLPGEIPGWLAMIVVSRDLLIIGGVLLAMVLDRPIEVRPLYISKINTAAQIIFAALVLGDLAFSAGLSGVRDVFVYIVGVLTIASAAAYRGLGPPHGVPGVGAPRDATRDGHPGRTAAADLPAPGLVLARRAGRSRRLPVVFSSILLPFVAGAALAYLLDPIADWLERRGLSRTAATLLMLVIFAVVFVLILAPRPGARGAAVRADRAAPGFRCACRSWSSR